MAQVLIRLLIILYSLHRYGHATRFLPMIVWDHFNPLLSCKCNWLTIPRVDNYDRLAFVCPTLKIAVKLLDGYSRPTGEMNENIFRRKWQGSVNELKDSIRNGTLDFFCDPKHNDTDHLNTCKDGVEGKSLTLTFKNFGGDRPEEQYEEGLYVFFSNGHDGKVRTLSSTNAKCTMVFAVELSSTSHKVDHDMSYGKCLNPDDVKCKNASVPCTSVCNPELCPIRTKPPSSSPSHQLCSSYFSAAVKTGCPTPSCKIVTPEENAVDKKNAMTSSRTTMVPCRSDNIPQKSERKASDDFNAKNFAYGMIAGYTSGITVCCLCFVFVRRCKDRGGSFCIGRKRSRSVTKHLDEDSTTRAVNHVAFNNEGFARRSPVTPREEWLPKQNGEATPMEEITGSSGIVGHSNRLPSVESSWQPIGHQGSGRISTTVKSENEVAKVHQNKGSGSFDSLRCQSPSVLPPIQSVEPRNSIEKNTLLGVDTSDTAESGRYMDVRQSPMLPPLNTPGEKNP